MLVRVDEQGIDVEVEIQDQNGQTVAHTDSPIERHVSQHAYLTGAPASFTAIAIVRAKEPAKVAGTVHLYVSDLSELGTATGSPVARCKKAIIEWAAADMAYASGRNISLLRAPPKETTAQSFFEAAEKNYRAALVDLGDQIGGSDKGALQLSEAAIRYYELQDWPGSAHWANAAAATYSQFGRRYLQARARAIMAAAWMEMATKPATDTRATATTTPTDSHDRLAASRAMLKSLAAFHARRGEIYEQTLQLNNIGVAFVYEGRFQLALPYFAKAKIAFGQLGENSRQAGSIQNEALSNWGLGRLSAALPLFEQALRLLGPTLYPDMYLVTLNNSGLAHYAAGHFDEAMGQQLEALDFATRTQATRAQARTLYGIGITQYAIGDQELAAQFLHSALDICTPQFDARTRMSVLRALAVIEHEQGDFESAAAHNREALALATAPTARGRIVIRLASDLTGVGDTPTALKLLDGVIRGSTSTDSLVGAMALVKRGSILRTTHEYQAAKNDLAAGLKSLSKFDSLAERFDAEIEMARLLSDTGHPTQALTTIRRALGRSREIRAQTANPEYRASITQSLRPALDLEIRLLRSRYESFMSSGQLDSARLVAVEALKASDDSRALGFDDWRAEQLGRNANSRLESLMKSSATLYRDMAERRFQLTAREDSAGADDPRSRQLRESIGRLRARVGQVNAEIARLSSGRSSASVVSPSLAEWSAQLNSLPGGSAIVEYWLGATEAFAWVVGRGHMDWVRLSETEIIAGAARKLHFAMRHPDMTTVADRLTECEDMYGLVIAPLASAIRSAENLVIVPDGALQYVSFAALRRKVGNEQAFLTRQFILSEAPALRFLTGLHRPGPGDVPDTRLMTRMLLVSDPVYTADDPRIPSNTAIKAVSLDGSPPGRVASIRSRGDSADLSRLPFAGREARQILSLWDTKDIDRLDGLDATRDNLLHKDLSSYGFIHIASHGMVDAEVPQLSALILSKYDRGGKVHDPYFRASDFLSTTLNAQAVVLSACDTALGRHFPGEGVIGLQYAALARGARAVVASLWPVADGIAEELMTDMYREIGRQTLASGGPQPATDGSKLVPMALGRATRSMIQRSPNMDPAIWAPFIVYVASRL